MFKIRISATLNEAQKAVLTDHLLNLPEEIYNKLKISQKEVENGEMTDDECGPSGSGDLAIVDNLEPKCSYCNKAKFRDQYARDHHLALCPKTLKLRGDDTWVKHTFRKALEKDPAGFKRCKYNNCLRIFFKEEEYLRHKQNAHDEDVVVTGVTEGSGLGLKGIKKEKIEVETKDGEKKAITLRYMCEVRGCTSQNATGYSDRQGRNRHYKREHFNWYKKKTNDEKMIKNNKSKKSK